MLHKCFLFCFHVLTDAGDDAPSRKEISHELVRLLLRRNVKTSKTLEGRSATFWGPKFRFFLFAVFLLCVLRATFRSRSNQTMGCATHHDHCAKSNVQCASMACGWCVAQTLLLTRVAKTTSTWRLSALPTAQEVSDQHFEKQFVLALRDPHLLWYTPPNSLPNGLPSSRAQARHSDLCTNYKQFGLKTITSQIENQLANHARSNNVRRATRAHAETTHTV